MITQIDSETVIENAKCQLELTKKANLHAKHSKLVEVIRQAIAKINQCKIAIGGEHFKNLPETILIE